MRILVGATLATASGFVVLWQSAHVAALFDLSFVANVAYRMAAGDVPYRDFPLPYPPLTFAVQAAIIRAVGPSYPVQIVYAVLLDAASAGLAYGVVLRIIGDWRAAAAICLPLIALGVHDILPNPFYDADATVVMLVGIALALWAERTADPRGWLAVGAVLPVAMLAKQNSGVTYMAAMLGAAVLARGSGARVALGPLAVGVAVSALLLGTVLQFVAGMDNVVHWTVGFASARLGTSPGVLAWILVPAPLVGAGLLLTGAELQRVRARLAPLIGRLLLVLPFAVVFGVALVDPAAAPVLQVWPLTLLAGCAAGVVAIARGGVTLGRVLPFVIFTIVTAAFLSQGVRGSSYALWPLLAVALAEPVRTFLVDSPSALRSVLAAGVLVLGAGLSYTLTEQRLSFIYLEGDVHASDTPALRGLSAAGPFVTELDDELLRIQTLVPATDALLAFPGEDPLYFALGRRPAFPLVQFDATTDPYTPAELRELRDRTGIRWVLLKRHLQLRVPVANSDAKMAALIDGFELVDSTGPYDLYRRR